jgi:type I restriction enzyme R subunit
MPDTDRQRLTTMAGTTMAAIAAAILHAINPEQQRSAAAVGLPPGTTPTEAQVKAAGQRLIAAAVKPLASNPDLRQELLTVKRNTEQVYDDKTIDEVTEAGSDAQAKARAAALITSFRDYLAKHKDEITALQVLYSIPHRHPR